MKSSRKVQIRKHRLLSAAVLLLGLNISGAVAGNQQVSTGDLNSDGYDDTAVMRQQGRD